MVAYLPTPVMTVLVLVPPFLRTEGGVRSGSRGCEGDTLISQRVAFDIQHNSNKGGCEPCSLQGALFTAADRQDAVPELRHW